MDFLKEKFRLIACDVDGTLVPEETHHLDPRFQEIIRLARKRNIALCFASGRQYEDLVLLAPELEYEISYIATNGSLIFEQNKVIIEVEMTKPDPVDLCREIAKFPKAHYVVSTAREIFVQYRDHEDKSKIMKDYPNLVTFVRSAEEIDQIKDTIVKVSLADREGIAGYIRHFQEKWGDVCEVAAAGHSWLDFTNSNKGVALAKLCQMKQIPLSETLVFGDNNNDIGMLQEAGFSFAMDVSTDTVKSYADGITDDPYREMLAYLQQAS